MVKDIKRRFQEVTKLISYQDTEVHLGTIYKASGWVNASTSRGGDWNNRQRNVAQTTAPKVRWEKQLR
jgi:hypothetical protein